MGSFANSIFNLLLGWVRAAARSLWALIAGEGGNFFAWMGENWLALTVAICVVCTVVDMIIHVIRWRPHKVWASFLRRITGQEKWQKQRAVRTRPAPDVQPEPPVSESEVIPQPVQTAEDQEAYRSRFARPVQEQGVYQRLPEMDRLQYQQLPPEKPETVSGPAGYPQPAKAESVVNTGSGMQPDAAESLQRESISGQMRQRMSQLQKNLGITEDESALEYHPAPPVFDEKEMYHAPVYPPNWQEPPRPQVTRTAPRRRTQHHEINRNA